MNNLSTFIRSIVMDNSDYPELKSGDIVCVGSKGLLSKLIRWFTRVGGENRTFCSHVGVMYDSATVCEAQAQVNMNAFFDTYYQLNPNNYWVEVWRRQQLSANDVACIKKKCMEYKGRTYGYLKILAHALDGLLSKITYRDIYLFRRLCRMDNYPICSWLVAYVYDHCVFPRAFGVEASRATPDDIHDHLINSNAYKQVWSLGTNRSA